MLGKKTLYHLLAVMGFCVSTMAMGDAALEKITILTEDYPPYSFKNAQGEVDGINTQKVKAALKKLNLNIPLQIQPWARAYRTTKDGENIFLFTSSRTPERENDFKWVAVLGTSDVSVYALKEKKLSVKNLDDLKKFKLGGVNEYRYLPMLYKNGFKSGAGGTIDLTTSDENNLQKLMLGRVDAILANKEQIHFIAKKANVDMSKVEKVFEIESLKTKDYIVTGKKTSDDIVAKFRKGFE